MRWVKLTLPWPLRARYPLITLRLTSSRRAGTLRKLVAVGTVEAAFHVGGDRRAGTADRRARLVSRNVRRRGCGAGDVAGGGASAATAGPAGGVASTGAAGGGVGRLRLVVDGSVGCGCDVGGDRLGHRAVVGEELLPRLADRLGVGLVLLVHLLDEPRVRPERWLLDLWHCHDDDRTARRSIPRQHRALLPRHLRPAAPVTCRR